MSAADEDGSGGSKPLGAVTAAFGLLAGLTALVAVLGGVALTLRFRASNVPMEAIVGGLPKQFFLSVGLDVTLQLLVFSVLIALAVRPAASSLARLLLSAVAAFVLAYPFFRIADGLEWLWLALFGVITIVVLWIKIFQVAGTTRTATGWHLGRELVLSVAIVVLFLFAVWRGVFEWAAGDVLDAKACLTDDQAPVSGLFVGENDNSLFIGVASTSQQPGRVTEIPRDQMRRLFIGKKAASIPCPPSPPASEDETSTTD